jgi:hypothetical protein
MLPPAWAGVGKQTTRKGRLAAAAREAEDTERIGQAHYKQVKELRDYLSYHSQAQLEPFINPSYLT